MHFTLVLEFHPAIRAVTSSPGQTFILKFILELVQSVNRRQQAQQLKEDGLANGNRNSKRQYSTNREEQFNDDGDVNVNGYSNERKTPTPMGTGIEGALRMTGTTTGRGSQRVLSDNGNANRYGNSKSAYRRELRERVQEFKERLETTSKATGTGIQGALTDDSNWKKNPRTGMSRSNS
jgi:hypothetical protein